jgi:alginate O-acetyltransferase complex protein AlgI
MWLMAVAIYAGFKWLTFAISKTARTANWGKSLGYLFSWTGMDAEQFFANTAPIEPPRWSEWVWSLAQLMIGFWLLIGDAPQLIDSHPLLAGWVAMTGIVSILHFGVSHLLSLVWRSFGVNAQHIMHKPLLARSVSEFWGKRWNLAFRDVMHGFVFRPLAPMVGLKWATAATFFASGVIHDCVISFTGRGGWGWPTLYFLIQPAAMFIERSRFGRRIGLGRGLIGWLFALAVVVGPAGLLFHGPFIEHVVVPMVRAMQDSGL